MGELPDAPSAPWKAFLKWSLPVLLAVAFALAAWSLDRASIGVAVDAYRSPSTVAANALPGLLACLALFVATRRLLFSFLLGLAAQALVYKASSIKLDLLESPVALEDMYFLTAIDRGGIGLFLAYVDDIAMFLTILCAGLAVLALVAWREKPWFRHFGPGRLVLLALLVASVASLSGAKWPWPSLYAAGDAPRPEQYTTMPAILHSGLMSSLVDRHLERKTRSFDIDTGALRDARRLLATQAGPAAAGPLAGTRPDIIVVLSESFFDPRLLNRLDAVEDHIPNVRAWIEAGHGGTMKVPTYGGGTIKTEFEVLTGMPVDAFPDIGFPYMDLDMGTAPTLPKILARDAGYRTLAIHGNQGSFYNRAGVYGPMGFQKFITAKEFDARGSRDGLWYSDESMTGILIEELESDERPLFAFAISMENHGPYGDARGILRTDAWERIEPPEGLGADAEAELRTALYHLGNADAQFARLLDALQRRNRPYLLLFFGDHLPALQHLYPALGFTDGRPAFTQRPPWVLIAGKGEETWLPERHVGFSWQLPALLAHEAGIGNAYFDFSRQLGAMIARTGGSGPDPLPEKALAAAARANLAARFEAAAK